MPNHTSFRNPLEQEPSDEPQSRSMLGTPVYSNLMFLKTSGTSLDNSLDINGQSANGDVILKIDTVLFTVVGTKNVIKTPIAGRTQTSTNSDGTKKKSLGGTVKEYVSMGDYQINVKGSIISQFPNQYPEDEVRLFIELLELPKALPIVSKFLDLFGITSFVIDPEYTISEKMGSRNEVPFEFNAVSDFPDDFELSISS